jgi:hypothetical protein
MAHIDDPSETVSTSRIEPRGQPFLNWFKLSGDFVSQEHGVPHDGPKDSNAGGCTCEIKIATKHNDGSLETPESTAHDRETPSLPRFRALVVR